MGKAQIEESGQRITTPEFRVSFPHVFKPSAIKNTKADPKFSITMLFKKTQDLSNIKLAMKHAKVEKFGPDSKSWPDGIGSPVQDGDDHPDREGYAGHWVIKASSSQEYKPTVVNEEVEEIINPSEFYAGCYAKAQIYARVHDDFGNGQGVHFILDMVQKTRDGKPFSGKKSAKEVFSPIAGDSSRDEAEDEGF